MLTILTGFVCTTIALAASANDPERGRGAFEKMMHPLHAVAALNTSPTGARTI
jgi:hypothetical protein